MKLKGECPKCGGAISVFDGFKAVTWRLQHYKCYHCKTQLIAKMPGLWLLFTIEICLAVVAGVVIGLTLQEQGVTQGIKYFIIFLLVVVLFEIGACILIFNFGQFTVRNQDKK